MTEKMTDILREKRADYWGERLWAQLHFGAMLSARAEGAYDAILQETEAFVAAACGDTTPPTPALVLDAEKMLAPLGDAAKEYRVICASHAHIDMNWQWGWDETVAVAIDTVTTMLKLMEEYPTFHFSLSQASTYKIIYDYAPALFAKIKARVHEGRWEVTAPSWVECDKNMPSGESLARQIFLAKEFLAKALDIEKDSINLDFEPDTFGHSLQVPEILANAGVKYYYHCRGTNVPHNLYRWQSPAGSEILVNRELNFYSTQVTVKMGPVAIETADKNGFKTSLRVYGVGDHGGGPSRRDIERLADMAAWPCFPDFVLGTYGQFFAEIEPYRHTLPLVTGEINFIFDGCFSSQSKIKAANRKIENLLYASEALTTAASTHGIAYPGGSFHKAWETVCLSHFHDIVTGSGVEATRHHALGMYQEATALTETARKLSLKELVDRIPTDALLPLPKVTVTAAVPGPYAEGAGVGSGQAEHGLGKRRVYHIFSPLAFPTTQVTELMLWDWHFDTTRLTASDAAGNPLPVQVLDQGFLHYWGHHYVKALVQVHTPALGYTTLVLDEGPVVPKADYWPEKKQQWREEFVLENEFLRVEIDSLGANILTVTHKESGKILSQGGAFRYILEGNQKELSKWDKEMSSWLVGRYKEVECLGKGAELSLSKGILQDSITAEFTVRQSKITCTFSLAAGSSVLACHAKIDWLETGDLQKGVPQLAFYLPLPYQATAYQFDVPFGSITREAAGYDLPGNSYAAAEHQGFMTALFSHEQYGYRCDKNSLSTTLLRSSFDPDPFPELGAQEKKFGIYFGKSLTPTELHRLSQCLNTPLTVVSNGRHGGTLPHTASYLALTGDVCVSSIKTCAHGQLLRLYEANGVPATITLPASAAFVSDLHESLGQPLPIENGLLTLTLKPFSLCTLIIVPPKASPINLKIP